MADEVETVLNQIEQQQEAMQKVIPKDIRALQLLQMEYRGEIELTHHQRRAAMAALPFEEPKLAVTTNAPWTDSLADALDRALQRSGKAHELKLIEHQPAPASPRQFLPTPAFRVRVRRRTKDFAEARPHAMLDVADFCLIKQLLTCG